MGLGFRLHLKKNPKLTPDIADRLFLKYEKTRKGELNLPTWEFYAWQPPQISPIKGHLEIRQGVAYPPENIFQGILFAFPSMKKIDMRLPAEKFWPKVAEELRTKSQEVLGCPFPDYLYERLQQGKTSLRYEEGLLEWYQRNPSLVEKLPNIHWNLLEFTQGKMIYTATFGVSEDPNFQVVRAMCATSYLLIQQFEGMVETPWEILKDYPDHMKVYEQVEEKEKRQERKRR